MRRQAEWAAESGDMSAAYQTFIQAGEHLKAIQILGNKVCMTLLCHQIQSLDWDAVVGEGAFGAQQMQMLMPHISICILP